MRSKRQTRPPQKLADSDYSVTNAKDKDQKNVSKKDVVKDGMENIDTVVEGETCEGNSRKLDGTSGDIDSDVQNGNNVSNKEKDSDVDIRDKGVVEDNGDMVNGNKQNENDQSKKDEAQKLNRNGDKTYAAATTGNLNDLCKKLFVIPTEVDENGKDALASRLGKPLVMDNVTADMYRLGVGRIGYARVMIEVSAKKSLLDLIEVVYRDKNGVEVCRKVVKVVTEWLPPRCSECCVFGHTDKGCEKDSEGFEEVRNKRFNGGWNKNKHQGYKPNYQYQRKGDFINKGKAPVQAMYQKKSKESNQESVNTVNISEKEKTPDKRDAELNNHGETSQSSPGSSNNRGAWNVREEILEAFKKSANKYALLDPDGNDNTDNNGDNGIKEGCNSEENDVYQDENGIAQCMEVNDIEGRDSGVLT
ncbi:zinc knuckle CX2CX4HX4C [Artemisia annua]|uniref:Zinc knuckle CX2CX4HX4C n=1 Tax=Artemisia annua TaxID=35608 RepID=A0A2U1L0I1_ARTAN|nr:zinc knuckle CX2CX4HX4C [Artemisia annua]